MKYVKSTQIKMCNEFIEKTQNKFIAMWFIYPKMPVIGTGTSSAAVICPMTFPVSTQRQYGFFFIHPEAVSKPPAPRCAAEKVRRQGVTTRRISRKYGEEER